MSSKLRQVPVTVLTGFLGSGKTTLLNNILQDGSHGLRFAIIENEFGEVGVDDKLIKDNKQYVEDELVEVMNGCICCTVRGDLVEALKRMYKKVMNFDAILIETTGMADPAPVAQTFFVDEHIKRLYKLNGIITVVDAAHIETHLDKEVQEGAENESVEQIAFADRIILNKCDLLKEDARSITVVPDGCFEPDNKKLKSEEAEQSATAATTFTSDAGVMLRLEKLEKRIRAINSQAPIIHTAHSRVDYKELLNMDAFNLERVLEMDPEFLSTDGEHVHDDSVSSIAFSFPGMELNVNKLNRWISTLMREFGTELYRYKGILAVKGCQEKYVFQGVHMLFSGGLSEEHKWGSDEQRECRFVFIGKHMKDKHADRLKSEFLDCKAEETLRFQVGDEVEANVGQWTRAKVLKVWNEGNPYRLELQPAGTNVWGPIDDDSYVRAFQGKQ